MRVIEVNVGRAAVMGERRGRPFRSAIVKEPVVERVRVGPLGLEGDEQRNRMHHGGPNQAVYAYAAEDAAAWSEELGMVVDSTILGQNLTTEGVDVTGAVIGERWQVGSTLIEVTSPRVPCATLAQRVRRPAFLSRFTRAGRPGAYFRVLEEGEVGAGDRVELVSRPDASLTVAEVMAILLLEQDRAGELLAVPALNPVMLDWARQRS